MSFQVSVQERLSDYKVDKLGVRENGFWRRSNDRPYAHILPDRQWDLNLLDNYRANLFCYIKENRLRLHPDFHHLTCSQAVCFNFFYPFLAEAKEELLLQVLGIQAERGVKGEFEKVSTGPEPIRFDFGLKWPSGRNIFFKITYMETSFGSAPDSPLFRQKYEQLYREPLAGKIRPSADDPEKLRNCWGLVRRLACLEAATEDMLLVICPENNQKLHAEWDHLSRHIIHPSFHSRVRLVTWETVLSALLPLLQFAGAPRRMRDHYAAFEEKYVYKENKK